MAAAAIASAGLVSDEHLVWAERVAAGAASWRADHCGAVGGADEVADGCHIPRLALRAILSSVGLTDLSSAP